MPFFQSLALRHLIKNTLESEGMKPEVAAYIGSVAGLVTAVIFHDHHITYISDKSSQIFPDSISEIDFDLEKQMEIDSDALVNETKNIIASLTSPMAASVLKEYDNVSHNSYTIKTEEIFSQIDLAQARITKDQEEIQSLAKETDELLNQLEYKAS